VAVRIRTAKYPWDNIRSAYVEGIRNEHELRYPTLEELAHDYGPDPAHLRRRASAEGWAEQRKMYQKKLDEARQDEKVSALAREAVKFDQECLELARVGMNHVRGHFLAAQDKFKNSNGKEAMAATMLERLSRAAERYQKVGRLALGEPTEHSREDGAPENVITDEAVKAAFGALYGNKPSAEGPAE